MSVSAHFNAPTAAALVLGGTAAIVLATVMAFRGSHRQAEGGASAKSQAAVSSTPPFPGAAIGGAPTEAEVEYLLDTGE